MVVNVGETMAGEETGSYEEVSDREGLGVGDEMSNIGCGASMSGCGEDWACAMAQSGSHAAIASKAANAGQSGSLRCKCFFTKAQQNKCELA